jgi:hypothetical protein
LEEWDLLLFYLFSLQFFNFFTKNVFIFHYSLIARGSEVNNYQVIITKMTKASYKEIKDFTLKLNEICLQQSTFFEHRTN